MLTSDQTAFLVGRIHAIKNRMDKATRRIERSGETGNKLESERKYRLEKILALHNEQPEEAIKIYDKPILSVKVPSLIPDITV